MKRLKRSCSGRNKPSSHWMPLHGGKRATVTPLIGLHSSTVCCEVEAWLSSLLIPRLGLCKTYCFNGISYYVGLLLTDVTTCAAQLLGSARLQYRQSRHSAGTAKKQSEEVGACVNNAQMMAVMGGQRWLNKGSRGTNPL